MAHITEDRILETTTTTGTGPLALSGAVSGFKAFADKLAVSDTCWYVIQITDGAGRPTGAYEYGKGTYTAANELTRTAVYGSSNADAAVNLPAGTKQVMLGILAPKANTAADWRSAMGALRKAGDTMTGALEGAAAVAVASATPVDMWSAASNDITLTGTTNITSFGANTAGQWRRVTYTGAGLSITHNSVSLILPGQMPLKLQTGDVLEILGLGGSNVRVLAVNRQTGIAVQPTNPNILINGDPIIHQLGTAPGSTQGRFIADGWRLSNSQSPTTNVQGAQGFTDVPDDFLSSLVLTVPTALVPGAGAYLGTYQAVEGTYFARYKWGTANAVPLTLSFWVKATQTGTLGLALTNGAGDRSYVAPVTINAANTWEWKTLTVPGDTSGTWPTDTGTALRIRFGGTVGTTYQTATTNAWQAGLFLGPTGVTNFLNTTGAILRLSGVKLEKGTAFTGYPVLDLTQEQLRCGRYLQRFPMMGVGKATAVNDAYVMYAKFFPEMRIPPAVAYNDLGTAGNLNTSQLVSVTARGCRWNINASGAGEFYLVEYYFYADAGLP